MERSFRVARWKRRLVTGVAIGCTVLVMTATLASFARMRAAREQVWLRRNDIDATTALLVRLEAAELHRRAYLATGRAAFLGSWRLERDAAARRAERLRALTREVPELRPSSDRLTSLALVALARMDSAVAGPWRGPGDAAAVIDAGEATLVPIRAATAQLQRREWAAVERWHAREYRGVSVMLLIVVLGSLASGSAMLLLSSFLRRMTDARAAEARFRAMAEAMPHMVWSARPDGRFDYVNSRFVAYAGAADLHRGSEWGSVHPEDAGAARAAWGATLKSGEPLDTTLRLRNAADGSYRWFGVRAAPVREATGAIVRWVGTCTDVHEERSREGLVHTLYELGEALSGAVTVVQVAEAVCDWGRRVLGADHALVGLLTDDGKGLKPLAGIGVGARYVGEDPLPLDAPAAICAAARSGSVVWADSSRERERLYPLTRGIVMEGVAGAPLRLEGRLLGAWSLGFGAPGVLTRERLELLEAVTAQCAQAMERALLYDAERRSRSEAERANVAKLKFLRIMSHDLRTPLNAIMGYTELLQGGYVGSIEARQAEFLARIRASTEVLRTQIEEVLEFTRVEAGQVQINATEVPILILVERIMAMVVPQTTASGIVLICEPCAPELAVWADEHRVAQILMNLVTNAAKFTPAGGTIELTAVAEEAVVHLSVADTGPGIPADALERIFEPFVQLEQEPPPGASRGVGLGLPICRDLARAMGGDVVARAGSEGGSVFTLTLPRATG